MYFLREMYIYGFLFSLSSFLEPNRQQNIHLNQRERLSPLNNKTATVFFFFFLLYNNTQTQYQQSVKLTSFCPE